MYNPQKKILVSCDFDTNMALVKIWKFRNYSYSGGQVFELKRDSASLKRIARIIENYRTDSKDLTINKQILWNGKSEKAIGYEVHMGRKHEPKNSDKIKSENKVEEEIKCSN
jgi:hypothetical protein